MHDPISTAKQQVRKLVLAAFDEAKLEGALPDFPMPDFAVDLPAETSHGDFAVNAALVSAKPFSMSPRDIAQALFERIKLADSLFSKAEIAGPGFLNFFTDSRFCSDVVLQILREKDGYGRTDTLHGEKIMVEFVSANPTGPMHLGNARGGALGDCLASVLETAGARVTREFYVNDAGNQIEKFACSLEARYLQLYKDDIPFPEDGYQGEDITRRAEEFAEINGDSYLSAAPQARRDALVAYALPANIEQLRHDLETYRIHYDVWFRESSLYESGLVNKVLGILKDKGATYENDGAIWYKATDYGAEKDEVLVRSNGIPTYFAADIAYHYDKFAVRGFERVINVWGADHHGHVSRLKGAMNAIGLDGSKLDVVLMQLVRLVRDGEPVRMSKRTGKAITLTDLLEEIPIDAARFFFNLREPKSHFEFDLDLAVKESSDNPVYYVQYAHARICSILKNLDAQGYETDNFDGCDLSLLCEPDELALIKHLAKLPFEITAAACEYDPARITRYTVELAGMFHRFYTSCRVKDCEADLCLARTALCRATKQVVANCLALLKINAPESM
ncbi:MAG: arginine--tRNA ligase [Oscillospiraceae bacterium]